MRSPIMLFGGKGNMTAKIVPMLPPHRIYVEPFGGGASVLLAKPPSSVEVYNDVDENLVGFFKTLADPVLFEAFYRRVAVLPYSRALYNECRATWREETDPITRAAKWFVVARQSFSGMFGTSWSFAVTASHRGMTGACSRWLGCLEALPAVHARLQRVQIECSDWRLILDTYDTPDTLFYCDPPYVAGTRRHGGYAHEMSDDNHRDFVARLLTIKGQAVVSGYEHPIYAPLVEAGWEVVRFETACHAVGRTRATGLRGKGSVLAKQARTEVLWRKVTQGRLL